MDAVVGSELVAEVKRHSAALHYAHLNRHGVAEFGCPGPWPVRTAQTATVPGVLGCARSHWRALQRARLLDTPSSFILICEDDSCIGMQAEPWRKVFPSGGGAAWPAALVTDVTYKLTRGATVDIIWLCASDGWNKRKCDATFAATGALATHTGHKHFWELRPASGCFLANAYLVRPHAIAILQRHLERGESADGALSNATARGELQGARIFMDGEPCNLIMQRSTTVWEGGSSIRGPPASSLAMSLVKKPARSAKSVVGSHRRL
jgi:hypothetical protein